MCPGSSPLARGTLPEALKPALPLRFIPARAGNTTEPCPWPQAPTVHPRSRGEHWISQSPAPRIHGSSPLARGTPQQYVFPCFVHRFIPARAGNTATVRVSVLRTSVHPRSRGEHRGITAARSAGDGSSPLARGTRFYLTLARRCRRFIPARAGNTSEVDTYACATPVHPRSRGEHFMNGAVPSSIAGLSPLARGTPRLGPEDEGKRRFIPARAGNTHGSSIKLNTTVSSTLRRLQATHGTFWPHQAGTTLVTGIRSSDFNPIRGS